MALSAATKTDLYRFMAIAFNAAPGTTYWSQLEAAAEVMTVEEIVEVFTTKSQFTDIYAANLTAKEFATKMVANVVGSSASDTAKAEGIADIEGALNAGWSRGKVIFTVFNNLANKPTTDATWGGTAQQLTNKVAYAQYFTETLKLGGGETPDMAALQAVISGVTNTTSTSAAALAAALNPVTTQTLTPGVFTYTGTDGKDTFTAPVGTFSADTSIDGKGGVDTLNAEFASDITTAPTVKDVEVLYLNNVVGGARTLNTSKVTGATQIWSSDSAGLVKLTNLASVGTTFGLQDTAGGMTLEFATDALGTATTANAVNMVVSGTTGGAINIGPSSLLATGGVQTLNITSTGAAANKLGTITDTRITGDTLKTIVVKGDKGLTIGGFDSGALATVDGSELAGDLKVSLGNALASTTTVKGGTGTANSVTANVTSAAGVKATLTNIQNFSLAFNDGALFDAGKTTVAAAYSLSGTGPNLANVVNGSTFKATALTAGAAASSIGFLGVGDFALTTSTRLNALGVESLAAVDFSGLTFTNVRDVTVTSNNKGDSSLGAIALGDLGRKVSLTANAKGGDITVGAITVSTDNVTAQELTLASTNTGAVSVTSLTSNADASVTLTSDSEGAVSIAGDVESVDGGVSATLSANAELSSASIGGDLIAGAGDITLSMVNKSDNAMSVDDVDASASGSGSVTIAMSSVTDGGDTFVNGGVSAYGGVSITAAAAALTAVYADGTVTATTGNVDIVLSGAKGSLTEAGGDAYVTGNVTASAGDVTVTLGAEDYARADLDGNVEATKGKLAVTATSAAESNTTIASAGTLKAGSGATVAATVGAGTATVNGGTFTAGDLTSVKGDVSVTLTSGSYADATIGDVKVTDGAATVVEGKIGLTASAGSAGTSVAGDLYTEKGDITVSLTGSAGTSTVDGGKAVAGGIDTDSGAVSVSITSGAKAQVEVGTVDATKSVTVTVNASAAGATTGDAAAEVKVGAINTLAGDVSLTVNAGAFRWVDVGAVKIDTAGNAAVAVTAGRSTDVNVGNVVSDVGTTTVSITTTTASTETFTDIDVGNIEGSSVVLSSTANSAGKTVTVGDLTATAAAGTGVVISAQISGTANFTVGTLNVANASNSTLIDARNLSGVLTVTGSAKADTISSGSGNDVIAGGDGADTISAGAGTDVITGGNGADTLTGGADADTFVIATAAASNTTDGIDRITDFVGGTDTLQLAVAASGTINTGSAGADLSIDSAAVASTGTTVAALLANLQTAADALAANEFDQAGDTFVVKITGSSLAGSNVFYVVQNTGADTNVTAADTIVALIGTSTAGLTVATVVGS